MELEKSAKYEKVSLSDEIETQIVLVISVFGAISVVLNLILIVALLRAPKLRVKPGHILTFAVLFVDLIFGALSPMLKAVSGRWLW